MIWHVNDTEWFFPMKSASLYQAKRSAAGHREEIIPFHGWGSLIRDQGFIRQTLGVMNRITIIHSHHANTQGT
jgi:hypothetical protein